MCKHLTDSEPVTQETQIPTVIDLSVLPVCVSATALGFSAHVPADVAVLRRVQRPLQLSSQPQGVCVLSRVGVVEEENHQQEEHVNQEVLAKDKIET